MTLLAGGLLAVVAFFVIGYPFFRRSPGGRKREAAPSALRGSSAVRAVRYDMRRELEADYRSGILSKEEYEAQTGDMPPPSAPGADANPALDSAYDEIEARVRAVRLKRSLSGTDSSTGAGRIGGTSDGTVVKPPKSQARRGPACPKCGAVSREGDRFCRECGGRLGGRGGR